MRQSLKTKMTCIVLIIAVVLSAAAILVGYRVYANTMDSYFKTQAMNLAKTVAVTVDKAAIERYSKEVLDIYRKTDTSSIHTPEDEKRYLSLYDEIEDDSYKNQLNLLKDIKRSNNILCLYVTTIDPQSKTGIYIMDSDESESACPIGTWDVIYEENQGIFDNPERGFPAYITNTDEFGWLCSAGAAITNDRSEVVGYAMLDVSMNAVMNDRRDFLAKLCFILITITMVLIGLIVYFVNNKVVRPINTLAMATGSFVADIEEETAKQGQSSISKLVIKTGDEIENLSDSIKTMEQEIHRYIQNLTKVTAEKERIGAELDVATHIQSSMLPCIFPAFPSREEFDIYATMQPAKEVGGDFYDFFLIDNDHLAVVIADVSGKGVPAALFMVIAKTLIKNYCQAGLSPADVFTAANRQLCENNEAGLFVTAWMGVLEINTGKFTYVNAGHNPPLIKRRDGEFEYLKCRPGFVLAGMEEIKYRQNEMELYAGDTLYLYTDGVTEATDTMNELYGEARLQEILNKNAYAPLGDLLPTIRADIDLFVKGAPQFDDITMLGLRISGGKL
ncbi:MAG: SpoIIE family protein phosphatase [Candidatus Fimivivens sp.]|nr:SpoIIE family protein phosphatase [Candidatus Fimivivens sp.]